MNENRRRTALSRQLVSSKLSHANDQQLANNIVVKKKLAVGDGCTDLAKFADLPGGEQSKAKEIT